MHNKLRCPAIKDVYSSRQQTIACSRAQTSGPAGVGRIELEEGLGPLLGGPSPPQNAEENFGSNGVKKLGAIFNG